MKRFLLPSFIVVVCTHLIVITLVMILSHVSAPVLIDKSEKRKVDTMSVWDIQEYIEPKLEIKPPVELAVEKNEPDDFVKPSPVIISKPKLMTAPAPISKKKILKQLKRVKKVTMPTTRSEKIVAKSSRQLQALRLRKQRSIEFQIKLRQLISLRLSYPSFARRMEQEGITKIKMNVLASGEFSEVQVFQTSGFNILDQDALELIHSLSRQIENKLKLKMSFIIPVEYNLKAL